ncbi:MAG: ABC transporter ATP-binding protein [Actinobacteria bacterium]|nr:ABC transporter ATP-binding protein [Actinomycetota bacterium]
MSYIVELDKITKKYGEVTAVKDFSFKIKEGEFFSLLGPSGCGKTTILRIIGGFIEQDSGTVIIDGVDMKGIPPNKRNTSMVFQNLALFPHMNVRENIIYGLKKRKIPAEIISEKLKNILVVVNLKELEKRRIPEISGGQQQRVALARSLIIEPKILLLDEPLASLDKKLRISMQSELKEIQRRIGTTFLYVTHDQGEALTMSDNIVVMNEGNLIQQGSPDLIYNRPQNFFVADFIGAGNFISFVSIEKNKDDNYSLVTQNGIEIIVDPEIIRNAGPEIEDSLTSDGKINLQANFFIRPEKISISEDFHPDLKNKILKNVDSGINIYHGMIISKVFEGPDTRLHIDSRKFGIVKVELKNDQSYKDFPEKSIVSFYWNYSDGIILTD